jgi:hypothetical protein
MVAGRLTGRSADFIETGELTERFAAPRAVALHVTQTGFVNILR